MVIVDVSGLDRQWAGQRMVMVVHVHLSWDEMEEAVISSADVRTGRLVRVGAGMACQKGG